MWGATSPALPAWFPRVAMIMALGAILAGTWLLLPDINHWLAVFCTVFTLRYLRFIGHLMGSWIYRPAAVQNDPVFTRRDVTVILPTVDPTGPDFQECVRSILSHRVAALVIITAGAELKAECKQVLRDLAHLAQGTSLHVSAVAKPSKRRQIAHAMPFVRTAITMLMDDHIILPDPNFIPSVLAPFEDPKVGMVATKKHVRRTTPGKWTWKSIVNFIACNYLERHNFELRSSCAIDGGLFVISGRAAAYRTVFLADETLLHQFCNEKLWVARLGVKSASELQPDDDNFLCRTAMKQGWLMRFQDTDEATIETTLGDWPKFNGQLLRWARTTFRSNPVMLRDPDFLTRYTWSAFMVYWAILINFAVVWDAALIFTLVRTLQTANVHEAWVTALVLWIIATKTTKILPHLLRHPSDWGLLIFQILFAYIHSFYKLWALLTFWDCEWSGRNLDEVNVDGEDNNLGAFELIV